MVAIAMPKVSKAPKVKKPKWAINEAQRSEQYIKMTKEQKKVKKVMGEFKEGTLHSGKKGPVVKSPKQAIAIALSEARKAKKK